MGKKTRGGRRRARAAIGWLCGLVSLSAAALGQQPPPPSAPGSVLRVDVDVVNVYCTVKDRQGRLVTDLEASDFEIREDGRKQEIRYFARETDRPLTLALLIDTSVSQMKVLPAEKVTAIAFLNQILRPQDDLVLVLSFDVSVDLLQDFTSDTERLSDAINRAYINAPFSPVNPGPFPGSGKVGTRLFDAIYLAANQKLAPEVGRKAIIVLTDGADFGSRVDEDQAIEAVQRSDTMVYAIGIVDYDFYRRQRAHYGGAGTLEKLARETGGRVIFPESAEGLLEAFDQIAAELRSQYSLGYSPSNRRRDGKFRKIKVRVKKKGLRVQARRGYYGPEP
ncbi:MAG: VWA domain-containing protein [Terriglobia bacterium]